MLNVCLRKIAEVQAVLYFCLVKTEFFYLSQEARWGVVLEVNMMGIIKCDHRKAVAHSCAHYEREVKLPGGPAFVYSRE